MNFSMSATAYSSPQSWVLLTDISIGDCKQLVERSDLALALNLPSVGAECQQDLK